MPKSKLPKERESKIQRAIVVRLDRLGVRLFRRNVGAMADKAGNFVRFAAAGQADLWGCLPASHGARHVEIEVKRPGNKPTPNQFAWLREMTARGCVAYWADDAGVAERVMRAVLDGGRIAWREDGTYDVEIPG